MVTALMMSTKMATSGLLKKKFFWSKCYDIIISVHEVTNKILWSDWNYIVNVAMWPKFGNSSISMREFIITSILLGCDQKNCFFERWSWFKFNNLGLAPGISLKFQHQCCTRVKTKSQRVLWANFYVCRSYRGKTG